ncbi:MAG TPA: beta-galactosidase [Acidobacteriaceae bacterium]|nr:beta-galactosidase [Acidobacteriaceae bacterium]
MKLNRRSLIQSMGAALTSPWLRGPAALAAPAQAADFPPAPAASAFPGTVWAQRAAHRREQTRDIVWLTHEPIEFLQRRGDHDADLPAYYARMTDPANIQRMAGAGVKWGRIFFYKGFGLDFEQPHMQLAKKVADQMHSLGMKVSLYMGGTMFTETLYHELPQAEGWEQRDQWNHFVPYGIQTYRHYACPNEPLYRDYLRKVIRVGVVDLRADELAFDNIMLQQEPHSCRCPRCIAAFAAFLKKHYPTRDAAMRRFGYPDTDWIRVNQWDSDTQPDSVTELNDPVLQEWVRFRCESLAHYANDLYDATKALNPSVCVHFNIKGVYSFNRYWTNAVYQPLFAGKIDMMSFDTGGYDEHIDAHTGALISQVRSYKLARRLETSCDDAFNNDVRAATHMAFGYQKPVPGIAPTPFGSSAFNVFTPLMEFFREHNERYYTGVDNVADVAAIRLWPSMAYSISAAYVPATLAEQVLIQYKVPFDLLFEEQLDRLPKYQAVLLAGQECISDEHVQLFLNYVRNGGTLILAGNTATYNQWRETRSTNPFLPRGVSSRQEGKGRIVSIPQIIPAEAARRSTSANEDPEPGATAQHGVHMNPPQWVLPRNHADIYRTIADGLPRGLSISTEAPLTTVMELQNRAESRETIAHFINFDRKARLAPFAVTLRRQFPGPTRSVTLFSPESSDPATLQFTESAAPGGGTQTHFTVPAMSTYSMIVTS